MKENGSNPHDGVPSSRQKERRSSGQGRREGDIVDSQTWYRELVENIEDVVYIVDGTGVIKYLNTSLERVTGYRRDELIGRNFTEITTPESLVVAREAFARQRRREDVGTFELSFITKEGGIITIETRERLVWEKDRVVEVYGIGRDITGRRRAEEALGESEERYRNLFETSIDTVYLTTVEGTFLDINRAGERLFGYPRDELLGLNVTSLYFDPDERKRFQRIIAEKGFVRDHEIVFKKRDGSPLDALITATVRKDATGAVIGYQGIIRDISERKRLVEQLAAAQKMEAVGALAGGIAHDFNNILATILGYASHLKDKSDRPDAVREGLSVIEESAARASELTAQLLAFSRRGKVDIAAVNLNSIVTEVHSLVSRTFDKSIRIELSNHADPLIVLGDHSQLNQVVMNLVINAQDAMPDGGTLTIRTFTRSVPIEMKREGYAIGPGEYACIAFSDTGIGMNRETMARIFEPYFTTRRDRGGTGLGMSVVYGIVKGHAGYIDVASEEGKGTEVEVYLPSSRAGEDVRREAPREMYGGTETILVVDDEPNITCMIKEIIEDFGYTALTAGSGRSALDIYRRRGPVDLVILDLVMPDMRGKEVLKGLLEADPKARVLLTSGYSDEDQHRELIALGARGFIGKPFVVERLLAKIREVLK